MILSIFYDNEYLGILIIAIVLVPIIVPFLLLKKYIYYYRVPREIVSESRVKNLLSFHFIGAFIIAFITTKYLIKVDYINSLIDNNRITILIIFLLSTSISSIIIGKLIDMAYSYLSPEFKNYMKKK